MIGQSLRDFLKMVEEEFPEEFVRVTLPVSREDITATVFELESVGKSPVVFFENVKGFRTRLRMIIRHKNRKKCFAAVPGNCS